jgi:hypothetical protein
MRFRSLSLALAPLVALVAACSSGSFNVTGDDSGGGDSGGADSTPSDTSVGNDAVGTDGGGTVDATPADAIVVVDGASCDTSKSPLDAPCVVADAFGFFVSATGDDANPGTAKQPFKTIAKAYNRASGAVPLRRRIFVCNETFTEQVTAADGVDLYGGLDCKNNWVPALPPASVVTTLNAIASPALVVKGFTSGAHIESFAVTAPHGLEPGGSSIGLLVSGSKNVVVRASSFNASLGGAGRLGLEGTAGASGAVGVAGVGDTACGAGATGTKGGAGGLTVTTGGAGGSCDCSKPFGTAQPLGGEAGALAATTCGLGGLPFDSTNVNGCASSNTGHTGCPGNSGPNGAAGKPLGATIGDGYVPADGADGVSGGNGGGGGGGGTARLAAGCAGGGGGGGGGGGAGLKGTGGGGGGASFGILSVNSELTLRATTAKGGTGGVGGNGGPGGAGGKGAAPGAGGGTSVGKACTGGAGGDGGDGGDGGGGGGGPSAGVAWYMIAPTLKDASKANAGQPGNGGGSPGAPGATGTAADVLQFP